MHMPRIVISQTLYCLDLPGIGRPGSAGGVRGSASPPTKEDETRAPGYSGPKAMERGSSTLWASDCAEMPQPQRPRARAQDYRLYR